MSESVINAAVADFIAEIIVKHGPEPKKVYCDKDPFNLRNFENIKNSIVAIFLVHFLSFKSSQKIKVIWFIFQNYFQMQNLFLCFVTAEQVLTQAGFQIDPSSSVSDWLPVSSSRLYIERNIVSIKLETLSSGYEKSWYWKCGHY